MVASGIDKEKLMIQFSRLEEHLNQLNEIKRGFKGLEKEDLLVCAADKLNPQIAQIFTD